MYLPKERCKRTVILKLTVPVIMWPRYCVASQLLTKRGRVGSSFTRSYAVTILNQISRVAHDNDLITLYLFMD